MKARSLALDRIGCRPGPRENDGKPFTGDRSSPTSYPCPPTQPLVRDLKCPAWSALRPMWRMGVRMRIDALHRTSLVRVCLTLRCPVWDIVGRRARWVGATLRISAMRLRSRTRREVSRGISGHSPLCADAGDRSASARRTRASEKAEDRDEVVGIERRRRFQRAIFAADNVVPNVRASALYKCGISLRYWRSTRSPAQSCRPLGASSSTALDIGTPRGRAAPLTMTGKARGGRPPPR